MGNLRCVNTTHLKLCLSCAKNMISYNTGLIGYINRKITKLNITRPPLQFHCIIGQHAQKVGQF